MTRRPLPDSVKRAIKRQSPQDAWRVGEGQRPAATSTGKIDVRAELDAVRHKTKRGKFGNVKTTDPATGESFDSKLERRVYEALVCRYGSRNVMRQWSLSLPGGVRIRPDFVVLSDPQADHASKPPRPRSILAVIDAKGMAPTRDWTNKAKMLYALTGINIAIANTPEDALAIVESSIATGASQLRH